MQVRITKYTVNNNLTVAETHYLPGLKAACLVNTFAVHVLKMARCNNKTIYGENAQIYTRQNDPCLYAIEAVA